MLESRERITLLPGRRACHRLLFRAIRKTYGVVSPWNLRIASPALARGRHYHQHDLDMTLNADFSNNFRHVNSASESFATFKIS